MKGVNLPYSSWYSIVLLGLLSLSETHLEPDKALATGISETTNLAAETAAPLPVLNEEGTTCPNALQTSEGASVNTSESGITATGLSVCALCDLDDLANLTDADTTNAATLSLGAVVGLTGGVEAQVVVDTDPISTGSTVGFAFETSGVLNTSVLSQISIQTYNGGTLVDDETLENALISASVLGSDITEASIITSGEIDEIRFVFDVDGLGVSVLTTYDIYYAFQNTPCECLSPDAFRTTDAANVAIKADSTGVFDNGGTISACVLCGVADEANLIDDDTTNFGSITMVAAANFDAGISVETGSTVPAGSTVGFVYEDALGLLDQDLLGALRIRTYNNGTVVDDVAFDEALIGLELLNGDLQQVSLETSGDIDELRFVITGDDLLGLLGVGVVQTINVYYGFVEAPCGCECEDALQEPEATVNADSTGIRSDGGLITLCVGCNVSDATNLVNTDTTDFANISIPVGLSLSGNYEGVLGLNLDPLPGGSKIGFVFEDAVGLIGADLLTALRIRTFNDGNLVDDVPFTSNLIGLQLLDDPNTRKALITTSGGIDEIQFVVDIDELLGLASVSVLQSINVFYAVQEIGCDNDNDGIPDDIDLDDDNDGIPDVVEEMTAQNGGDTDGDLIPDIFDLDADNDGVPDLIEAGGTDTDGDGVADDLTDDDGDGLVNIYDDQPNTTGFTNAIVPNPDSDSDGQPDFQDLDADNDTVNDIAESGISDTDNNALVDERNMDGTLSADADGDGLADSLDPNDNAVIGTEDGSGMAAITTEPDSDNDGQPDDDDADGTPYNGGDTDSDAVLDLRDLDSDNDTVNDIDENGNSDLDDNTNGYVDSSDTNGGDTDNDGIPNSADNAVNTFGDAGGDAPQDTDADTVPDFQDLDSDNDSVNDIDENGNSSLDTNGSGFLEDNDDNFGDTDGDGIADPSDEDENNFGDAGGDTPIDTDGEGTPDFQDADNDDSSDQTGDGTNDDIDDAGNSGLDSNNDGQVDDQTDDEKDGIIGDADEAKDIFGDAPLNPDITAIVTLVPNTIIGITDVNITVRIQELHNVPTNGEIVVRIPKENRLTFTYNPSETTIGFGSVDNADWTYDDSDAIFHIFRSSIAIAGSSSSTFGFTATYDPQNTSGSTTLTATIAADSGGDIDNTNNSDSEVLNFNH